MENNITMEIAQLAYSNAKKELLQKVGTFALCMGVFMVFIKVAVGYESFADLLEGSFCAALMINLPFRIFYKHTGSIIGSVVGSFIMVIMAAILLGITGPFLAVVMIGVFVLDFGWSIAKLLKCKKMLVGNNQ